MRSVSVKVSILRVSERQIGLGMRITPEHLSARVKPLCSILSKRKGKKNSGTYQYPVCCVIYSPDVYIAHKALTLLPTLPLFLSFCYVVPRLRCYSDPLASAFCLCETLVCSVESGEPILILFISYFRSVS